MRRETSTNTQRHFKRCTVSLPVRKHAGWFQIRRLTLGFPCLETTVSTSSSATLVVLILQPLDCCTSQASSPSTRKRTISMDTHMENPSSSTGWLIWFVIDWRSELYKRLWSIMGGRTNCNPNVNKGLHHHSQLNLRTGSCHLSQKPDKSFKVQNNTTISY